MQLDRLEEIERTLAEIDPTQFVRVDGVDPTITKPADYDEDPSASGAGYESVENSPASADASSGPDIGAIIAADDRGTDHHEED